jgi:hypothetical protein
MLRGIISTLSNPKGSIFIPVSAPIFLRKLKLAEKPELGIISGEHDCYDTYQSLLATVLTEEFGIFAIPQHSADRPRQSRSLNHSRSAAHQNCRRHNIELVSRRRSQCGDIGGWQRTNCEGIPGTLRTIQLFARRGVYLAPSQKGREGFVSFGSVSV